MWCIGALTKEYRQRMYDLLDLYARPFRAKEPVVCLRFCLFFGFYYVTPFFCENPIIRRRFCFSLPFFLKENKSIVHKKCEPGPHGTKISRKG